MHSDHQSIYVPNTVCHTGKSRKSSQANSHQALSGRPRGICLIALPNRAIINTLSPPYTHLPSPAVLWQSREGNWHFFDLGIPYLCHLLDAWTSHMAWSPSAPCKSESDPTQTCAVSVHVNRSMRLAKEQPGGFDKSRDTTPVVQDSQCSHRLCKHAPRHGGMASHRRRTPQLS
jgi:hypothetical protein